MGLYRRSADIRDWILHMRLVIFFYGLHHRESHLRYWVRRDLLWKSHHQRKSSSS